MTNALNWILHNHLSLSEHFMENASAKPTPSWWVNAAVVYGITSVVNVIFIKIQAKDMLLSQQKAEVDVLVGRLRSLLFVEPAPTTVFEHDTNDVITTKYWLKEQHLIDFVKDQGTFVKEHLDNIEAEDKKSTLEQLGTFILHVIEGMVLVQAERDSNSQAAASIAPPVMPSELVLISPCEFAEDVLDPRRDQLAKFWSESQIDAVEREHRELCQAKLLNELVGAVLEEESYETSFNDWWDAIQKAAAPKTYSHLRQFCCGLATVFANTASVESDFSILKWEVDDRRTALTSLPLEGIFQAKQFNQLTKL